MYFSRHKISKRMGANVSLEDISHQRALKALADAVGSGLDLIHALRTQIDKIIRPEDDAFRIFKAAKIALDVFVHQFFIHVEHLQRKGG